MSVWTIRFRVTTLQAQVFLMMMTVILLVAVSPVGIWATTLQISTVVGVAVSVVAENRVINRTTPHQVTMVAAMATLVVSRVRVIIRGDNQSRTTALHLHIVVVVRRIKVSSIVAGRLAGVINWSDNLSRTSAFQG